MRFSGEMENKEIDTSSFIADRLLSSIRFIFSVYLLQQMNSLSKKGWQTKYYLSKAILRWKCQRSTRRKSFGKCEVKRYRKRATTLSHDVDERCYADISVSSSLHIIWNAKLSDNVSSTFTNQLIAYQITKSWFLDALQIFLLQSVWFCSAIRLSMKFSSWNRNWIFLLRTSSNETSQPPTRRAIDIFMLGTVYALLFWLLEISPTWRKAFHSADAFNSCPLKYHKSQLVSFVSGFSFFQPFSHLFMNGALIWMKTVPWRSGWGWKVGVERM